MYLNPQSVKFLEVQYARKNEIKILTSFYYELKRQHFSFTVYDGERYNKIDSLDEILAFHRDLDEMLIYVERDNLKEFARFIFGCGESVLYCLYDYSSSLKIFINETLALMQRLATKLCETLEREQIRRFPVTCPVCGSSAIEYHYPNSSIEIICYGHCGNTFNN